MVMTNEEIDAEIARLTALKEQNNAQQIETRNPANGIYNPADYISQITKALDEQRLDGSMNRGNNFSSNLEIAKDAGRRTGFEQDKDGTPLPETAYEWIVQQMSAARARGPVSEYTLKAIENGAKVRYNLPTDFDISGKGFFSGNTDRNLAKAMNSLPYNGNMQTPSQNNTKSTQSQNTQTTQSQNTQITGNKSGQSQNTQITGSKYGQSQNTQITGKSTETQNVSSKTKLDDERTAAYKRIKAKQASDADLALFKDYTEEQLRKIGFGTISVKAIKDAAGAQTQQTTSNGLSDEDKQFIQQYKQYTQQLAGSRPSSQAALNAMQESDAHKFVTDPANKERYNSLIKKQNEVTKELKKQKKQEKQEKQQSSEATNNKQDDIALMRSSKAFK